MFLVGPLDAIASRGAGLGAVRCVVACGAAHVARCNWSRAFLGGPLETIVAVRDMLLPCGRWSLLSLFRARPARQLSSGVPAWALPYLFFRVVFLRQSRASIVQGCS